MRSKQVQALVLGSAFVFGAWFLIFHVREFYMVKWQTANGLLTDVREAVKNHGLEYGVESDNGANAKTATADGPERDGIVSILPVGSDTASKDAEQTSGPEAQNDRNKAETKMPTSIPEVEPFPSREPKMGDQEVSKYIQSIMNHNDNTTFSRLACPASIGARYNRLRKGPSSGSGHNDKKIKYFFALDLYNSIQIMPRLMGSIVETLKYLGPEYCAVSIVEGRSDDGTYEVLSALKTEIESMGAQFHFNTSSLNPLGPGENRIELLSELRNMALEPLKDRKSSVTYSLDAIVIFINDIALCPEDILELVHQHVSQAAHMTCAFDWIGFGATFYDVWVSRSMSGNIFFEVTQGASWEYKDGLFWDDPPNKKRYEALQPLQVYSCWGGMVTLDAAPFVQGRLKFRSSEKDECYMGEPTLLAKDMWKKGLGKVLAVPTVNVAYTDEEATRTKEHRGYVSDHVDTSSEKTKEGELVEWQNVPPGMLKCLPSWGEPSWVRPVKT